MRIELLKKSKKSKKNTENLAVKVKAINVIANKLIDRLCNEVSKNPDFVEKFANLSFVWDKTLNGTTYLSIPINMKDFLLKNIQNIKKLGWNAGKLVKALKLDQQSQKTADTPTNSATQNPITINITNKKAKEWWDNASKIINIEPLRKHEIKKNNYAAAAAMSMAQLIETLELLEKLKSKDVDENEKDKLKTTKATIDDNKSGAINNLIAILQDYPKIEDAVKETTVKKENVTFTEYLEQKKKAPL